MDEKIEEWTWWKFIGGFIFSIIIILIGIYGYKSSNILPPYNAILYGMIVLFGIYLIIEGIHTLIKWLKEKRDEQKID